MWRLLLLSTFLVAVDASSVQDLDGEWVSVAFYPVSTYAPICPKYAILSNPEDPNCSCSDGKKYNSISISYVIAGQIIGNQVEPNACVIMVNTADEVASALAATCKCGEKEVKDHGVVRILNNNYFVMYSLSGRQTYTAAEPNTAYIFAKKVETFPQLEQFLTTVEDLKNRRSAVMCASDFNYDNDKNSV